MSMAPRGGPMALPRDLPDLCAFILATELRLGEVVAVLWSEVDLEEGAVDVTSTLIRVTGQGLIRKTTKSTAGQRRLPLPQWCVAMLRRRAESGAGPDRPVFGTVDGGFRESRTVSRSLHEVRANSDLEWVTSHAWRKTTASILDGSGVAARIIADQLGHSRAAMTQDVNLGRGEQDPGCSWPSKRPTHATPQKGLSVTTVVTWGVSGVMNDAFPDERLGEGT